MSTFYDRALSRGDADTFATRVLSMELTDLYDSTQQRIHVETLLCLLRDAYNAANPAAVAFIRPFLDGLLRPDKLAEYEQSLSALLLPKLAPAPEAKPSPPSGGLKVESAKPEPVQPSPAAKVAPRQSSSLAW